MSNKDEKNVSYGFIKPSVEQVVYLALIIIVTVIIALKPVREVLWLGITASIWIMTIVAAILSVYGILRMSFTQKPKK